MLRLRQVYFLFHATSTFQVNKLDDVLLGFDSNNSSRPNILNLSLLYESWDQNDETKIIFSARDRDRKFPIFTLIPIPKISNSYLEPLWRFDLISCQVYGCRQSWDQVIDFLIQMSLGIDATLTFDPGKLF